MRDVINRRRRLLRRVIREAFWFLGTTVRRVTAVARILTWRRVWTGRWRDMGGVVHIWRRRRRRDESISATVVRWRGLIYRWLGWRWICADSRHSVSALVVIVTLAVVGVSVGVRAVTKWELHRRGVSDAPAISRTERSMEAAAACCNGMNYRPSLLIFVVR